MIILTLVRHGESTGNQAHKWQGITDAALTNHGMRQAELAGKALKSRQFSAIISSPLQRAYHTAEAIYKEQDIKPTFTTDCRLVEVHMGAFEDKNWNTHRMPKVEGVPYRQQPFPGGGESRHDAFVRATAFLTDLFSKYPVLSSRPINILIVAHGMFLREMANALHSMHKVPWNDIRWHNTAVTTFQITTGGLVLIEKNNTSHLKSLQRQRGGIGSSSHDRNQQKLHQYFGNTA